MKVCLQEIKRNFYWILMALIIGALLWMAPVIVNATLLDDYLESHKLKLPILLEKKLEKMELIPAYGMNLEDKDFHRYFVVHYIHKKDIAIDIEHAEVIVKVKYDEVKKKVSIEYMTYKNKIWGAVEFGAKQANIELWDL